MNTATFKSKLNSVMKDNMFDREVNGKRSGSIDTKSLYKIGHSIKVFKKKEERENKNYNITLLIDASGSMYGYGEESRIKAVGEMLKKFIPVLKQIKGIKLQVKSFDHHMYMIKDFNDNSKTVEQMYSDIYRKGSGSNYDGLAIASAANGLIGMKGKNILIVFSDGEPCIGGDYVILPKDIKDGEDGYGKAFEGRKYTEFDLKKEVRKAIRKGIVFIGVGVQTNAVYQYYPRRNTCVVENLDTMFSELIRVFNRQLQRK